MAKQTINLNELHEQFLDAGFVDMTDEELQNVNGGIYFSSGYDASMYMVGTVAGFVNQVLIAAFGN
ncbi:hypothetical protein OfM1_11970 [Lactovum odontotermitis]